VRLVHDVGFIIAERAAVASIAFLMDKSLQAFSDKQRFSMSGSILLAAIAVMVSGTTACAEASPRENKWGPFEGRVVDAQSGDGILRAAVNVMWMRAVPDLVEGHDQFHDARWAVTASDGHFKVPRREPPFFRLGKSGAYLNCVAPGYFPYEFKPTDLPKD